jgi:DNA-binding GntR family transcriptional regulator
MTPADHTGAGASTGDRDETWDSRVDVVWGTRVEVVTSDLRRRILDGEFAPGAPLRESALAGHYEVARHTLRAALRDLAAEHLVSLERNRGARVAVLVGEEARALFERRTGLEVEAVRLLAARRGLEPWPAEVLRLGAELDAAARAVPPHRPSVDAAHSAFHHALVAAAGSQRITAAHAALAAESRLALLQSRTSLPVDHMARIHRDLLVRLTHEGPEALRAHLEEGHRLSQPGQDAPPHPPTEGNQPRKSNGKPRNEGPETGSQAADPVP